MTKHGPFPSTAAAAEHLLRIGFRPILPTSYTPRYETKRKIAFIDHNNIVYIRPKHGDVPETLN